MKYLPPGFPVPLDKGNEGSGDEIAANYTLCNDLAHALCYLMGSLCLRSCDKIVKSVARIGREKNKI